MSDQLSLFDWQERAEQRIAGIRDEIVAYAGEQQRFTRRSKVPSFVIWHLYELLKEGKSPEQIDDMLRSRYPRDFERTGPSTLLTHALQRAKEEYLNSGHVSSYIAPITSLDHRKN